MLSTPAGKTPSDTLWIHDDLDIDDLDLDEELAKLEREEMQFSKDFLALEQAPEPAQIFLSAEPSQDEPHDEHWAQALLHENSSTEASLLPAADVVSNASDPQPTPNPDDAPAWDDSRAEAALDDSPAEALPTPITKPIQALRNEPPRSNHLAFELVDEPVQLDWREPPQPRSRRLLWGLLNLIALSALAGQYIFQHFDELARQDHYRPWFAQVCPLLGCTLPSKVDINQIKSSNLIVRAHPEFAGALIVDAIIYNRAPFAQPFPLLEMRFADVQGIQLASRRFKPAEYLAGELAGQSEMPSQTPIRISLEILDPGSNADNYSLNFQSPE